MKDITVLINSLHLEDLKSKLHPAIFDENDMYNMLIVRFPVLADEEMHIKSLGFIIMGEESYYYHKEEEQFEFLDDTFKGLHQMIDVIVDALLKRFIKFQDQIGDMEDNLYEANKHENFLTQWLGLKRDISQVQRILLGTLTAMQDFSDCYSEMDLFPKKHYLDITEHVERILKSATFQLSKLDYLYNFYTVRTGEKVNRMVYLLTVISSIFLPLNLAVGFFGMNTSGLPFSAGNLGTWYAVTSMTLLVLLAVGIYSKLKKQDSK